ncbi:hypothetical protein TTHERM_00725810 (macronuclear) [Tetrahymena thermophila SB210]|uniref:Uncharacterized protein n=1 Tax=Tetrahymena thermophila (strain SB210) TaxID=312017 RepID=Q24GK9_TETTS|nr:hypothetical protein TTHERM_00725810 [Tetrahymena thermophila SB210]EAS06862.2 hypothetical protein TTHERM_00725810 [Tetrahymena thermophila SB210]|eukprot:XP_001027104.2 hypothetical protein TTHERM_00725810 [Tetrahymena thermophila SB210]
MSVQKVKKLNKVISNDLNNVKNKRKDILITKKIEKLIQKRQLEVVPINFTLELTPKYQFYILGEIVVDFDIFKEDKGGFKQNPTNLFKILEKMTRCKNHLEFQTASNVPMMNNFEIIISTIDRANHPKAKEMSSLLRDYQEKVSRRCKYASILQKQQEQKQVHIDYAQRKEESFENAQKIIDSVCRDNPNSIFFFVIRRKGMFSIDVLKSGYSNAAIKLSGFTLEEFEQCILRDRSVPIKHQNNAWDYIKEKMYSNFHNKNYSNIQRKFKLKNGQEMNIFLTAKTFPLNINLSPDPNLLDLNDYLELILIEPFISKIDRFQEANDIVIKNQQQYIEQTNKFIQAFYSKEEMKQIGFINTQTKPQSQIKKNPNEAQLQFRQNTSNQILEGGQQNYQKVKQLSKQEDISSDCLNIQQFKSKNQNTDFIVKEILVTNQFSQKEDQINLIFNPMSNINSMQQEDQSEFKQDQTYFSNQANKNQIPNSYQFNECKHNIQSINKENNNQNTHKQGIGSNYNSDSLVDDKSSNLFQSSEYFYQDDEKKDQFQYEDSTKYLNQQYLNNFYSNDQNCFDSKY